MSDSKNIKRIVNEMEAFQKAIDEHGGMKQMIEEQKSLQQIYEPPDYVKQMMEEQESIRKMCEPPEYMKQLVEEQQKSFQHIYESPDYVKQIIKDQEASFRKMYEPSGVMRQMIEEIQKSFQQICELPDYIKRIVEEQENIRKMYEPPGYIKQFMEEQESLRKMFEPPKYLQTILKEQKRIQELLDFKGVVASTLQAFQNQENFNPFNIAEKINEFANNFSTPNYYIHDDGSISLENQRIDFADLSIEVSDFLEEISEKASIDLLLSRLSCLKKPAQNIAIWIINNILITFLVSVIAALLTPDVQKILDSHSLTSSREVTKAIKTLPREIDLEAYGEYRVVTADILNLRQSAKMKSQVLAKLNRGKLVRVIQKRKNWTQVEVEVTDSVDILSGWVATRYIVPLRR
ncbi:SH3 domain-containing protein [Desulfobacter vibrioformis]|uniref:SH3 domain-containing protein n=1 Tax=Desulfobacter vibrioformis TaxID=34031 RepID=UPI00054FF8DD|nr:SH3 domain-containing protein [Desulfobacter vibrioformis]